MKFVEVVVYGNCVERRVGMVIIVGVLFLCIVGVVVEKFLGVVFFLLVGEWVWVRIRVVCVCVGKGL